MEEDEGPAGRGLESGLGWALREFPGCFWFRCLGLAFFFAWTGLGWAWVTGASFANKGLPVLVGVLDHRCPG